MRKSATTRLMQQGEAPAFAPKVTLPSKETPKRKGVGKYDRPTKKATSQFAKANQEDQQQNLPRLPIIAPTRVAYRPMVPSSLAPSRDW